MSDRNTVFVTPVAGYEIKMPAKVLKEVKNEGGYVTTSQGKYAQIHAYVGGKSTYIAPLHAAIREGRVAFKDGNTFNHSKSNLVVL